MSLRIKLHHLIRSKRWITVAELDSFVDLLGFKRSNAERLMRKLCETGEVRSVKNFKHHIRAYEFTGKDDLSEYHFKRRVLNSKQSLNI